MSNTSPRTFKRTNLFDRILFCRLVLAVEAFGRIEDDKRDLLRPFLRTVSQNNIIKTYVPYPNFLVDFSGKTQLTSKSVTPSSQTSNVTARFWYLGTRRTSDRYIHRAWFDSLKGLSKGDSGAVQQPLGIENRIDCQWTELTISTTMVVSEDVVRHGSTIAVLG